MKRVPLFAFLFCLSLFAPGEVHAQTVPTPPLTGDAQASSRMSPQEAMDYMVKLVNDWGKAHPAFDPLNPSKFVRPTPVPGESYRPGNPLERVTPEAIAEIARQAVPLGFDNLLAIHGALGRNPQPGDLGRLLDQAARKAFSLTVQDGDLQAIIDAEPSDGSLIVFLLLRPAWKNTPQVVSYIEAEMDRTSGHRGGTGAAAIGQKIGEVLNLPAATGDSEKLDPGYRFVTLARLVSGCDNAELQKKLDSIMADASTNGDNYSLRVLDGLSEICPQPAYLKYWPGILTGMNSESKKSELDPIRASMIEKIYTVVLEHPEIASDPRMHNPIMQLAGPMIHDQDRGETALGLQALVGDMDSFRAVISSAHTSRSQTFGNGHNEASDLLGTIKYQGPPDKLKGVTDNLDACHFDTATGRWTLVVSGFGTPTPTP